MAGDIDRLLRHPVWQDTNLSRLIPLADSAREIDVAPDDVLFRRFHPAHDFYLLCAGEIAHETDDEAGAVPAGSVSWPWAAVGWSGFLSPQRYTTTARATAPLRLLAWRHDNLATCFYADPGIAIAFLKIVVDSVWRQLETARVARLAAIPASGIAAPARTPNDAAPVRQFVPSALSILRRSAFYEQFDDRSLVSLAESATLSLFDTGKVLCSQDALLRGLPVLVRGTASSFFEDQPRGSATGSHFRSISGLGAVVAGVPRSDGTMRAESTVVASSPCVVYSISADAIDAHLQRDPEFGRSYMQRNLARISNLLSAARVSASDGGDEPEIAAVSRLLRHSQTRISVNSELNKLPHLLGSSLTVPNALAVLHTVRETGCYDERSLARSCEEQLTGVRREARFIRDVLDAYVNVVDAPPSASPDVLRDECDEQIARAFEHLDREIRNEHKLPAESGNVFIINHLGCPAYYKFPNGYHFSFDTAFISVALSRRYGHAPVRVVRQSPGAEYGHNLFYSRLGHIEVPTLESGIESTDPGALEALRRRAAEHLMTRGIDCLTAGQNVLICPEGQSQRAADSPARFYSGAFRLALGMEPEPSIVPIAIAGFDRRYKDSRLVAVIGEPFRISERLEQSCDTGLRTFLDAYREEFAVGVHEAQALSLQTRHAAVA